MPQSRGEHLRAGEGRGLSLCTVAVWLGLATLASCGSPTPSPEQAARAILATRDFSVARTVRIAAVQSGNCSVALQAEPEWGRWIELGLASVNPVMTSSGMTCRLVLDETIARDAQSWSHRVETHAAGGDSILVIPVAVRSLLRVTEIRTTGGGMAEALFDWQWRSNEAGHRLGMDSGPRTGRAQLVLEEGSWRASRVDIGGE
jgi:hypothetical protein